MSSKENPFQALTSFKYDRDLDAPRPNFNGTYLDSINDSLEPLQDYRAGGYYPVHIGDNFGAFGQYRIIHKLSHGGFGTVWLCRDTRNDAGYVAVKVLVAHVKAESVPDVALAQLDRSAPAAEHTAMPLDFFTFEGPNGVHQDIVLLPLPCNVREGNFDDDASWLQDEEEWSLEMALTKPIEIINAGSRQSSNKGNMSLHVPEAEQKLMADLLYKLLRYELEQHLSAKEVLEHD